MSVHLIFDTETIVINRNTLLQFGYFRNLLEISPDYIKITNVNVDLFKILIKMLENNNLIKEIAQLSDFLDHDGGCEQLSEFKCHVQSCNKISLNKSFCEQHKCVVDLCQGGQINDLKYCIDHICKCSFEMCNDMQYNSNYCIKHKCVVNDCHIECIEGFTLCYSHRCHMIVCPNKVIEMRYFCEIHICKMNECHIGTKYIYCNYHRCTKNNCNKQKCNYYAYCIDHICKYLGCSKLCIVSSDYCQMHKNEKIDECYIRKS